jgi:hypothetical protein
MKKEFDRWNGNKKEIHLESESKLYHEREVILSQLRLIDTKRLQEKICRIDAVQFVSIKQKIIRMIG